MPALFAECAWFLTPLPSRSDMASASHARSSKGPLGRLAQDPGVRFLHRCVTAASSGPQRASVQNEHSGTVVAFEATYSAAPPAKRHGARSRIATTASVYGVAKVTALDEAMHPRPGFVGRQPGLRPNAVVQRGALDALGFSVLTLTPAISFCLFERTNFAPSPTAGGGTLRSHHRSYGGAQNIGTPIR